MLRDARRQRQLWRQARRVRLRQRVGGGLQTHPVLTIALLLAAVCAFVCLIVAVLTLALVAGVTAGAGFLVYQGARRMIAPGLRSERLPGGSPLLGGDTLQQYLYAVEEFSQLADSAVSQPLEAPARGKEIRALATSAQRLARLATTLEHEWQGDSTIRACLVDLASGSNALCAYLRALQSSGSRRPSFAELRWQRDDLVRRRDMLLDRLRATDFRSEVGRQAPPNSA